MLRLIHGFLLVLLLAVPAVAAPAAVGLPWAQARPVGVQAAASWDAARLGWLKAGETAQVLDATDPGWLKVRAGAVTGWVDRDWVAEDPTASVTPTAQTTGALPFLRFDKIGTAQGLPDTTVTAICQDQDGYLWFGTEGGLARFDGYDFHKYLHDPKDPNSLADSYIRVLLADPSGTIWVGTGEGLQALSPRTGKFTQTFQHSSKPDSLSHNVITSLLRDEQGQIWIGTEDGVCRLDPKSGRIERVANEPTPAHRIVRTVVELEPGRFWVFAAGEDGGSSVTEIRGGKQSVVASVTA